MKEYRIVTGRDWEALRQKVLFWQAKGFTVVEPKPAPNEIISTALKYTFGCVNIFCDYEPLRIMERVNHGQIYRSGSEDYIDITDES